MSKKIIGIDLGTTSIGWAYVNEAENITEQSKILRLGVRVNPLTTEEQKNFEKGKSVSYNADRTFKRGARRTLQRYKQRRANLIQVLIKHKIINADTVLAENSKDSTHSTYAIRAKAASESVTKEELAKVLLMINKKRGYKSSRKAKNEDEGQAIDGMAIAKRLYEQNLTPGQLCYLLLKENKKILPDFYRSDLNAELDKVWEQQKKFYPDILTPEFRKEIEGRGQRDTSALFWTRYKFNVAQIKESREVKKLRTYEWRSNAIEKQLSKEELAYIITEINSNINNSSGYLGEISDRSKELYFNKQTVGQYVYNQLKNNPHTRLKNQVFYRQDYLDEFEKIWETQTKFHSELTNELKEEIRDIIIFYQRKLKSQKNLISLCEFESKKTLVFIDGKPKEKLIGYKVAPKSSTLFQEFKIWQNLNNLKAQNKTTKEIKEFDNETKQLLFDELNIKGNYSKDALLSFLGFKPKEWELNFSTIEGNRTNQSLISAYLQILEIEGYDTKQLLEIKSNKDETNLQDANVSANKIKEIVRSIFGVLKINQAILDFNAELDGKEFEQQPSYQLWHLLYSYEGDNSPSGNEKLYELLQEKFGFALSHAKVLANVPLADDYGNLSAKAMRKIFPFIKELRYDLACAQAGYNHSSYLTKEENEKRPLKDELEILPKNSLRNPVVEKILNQMVNVINAILADPELGKPDEIRIELARELKKNAKEREAMTSQIIKATAEHEQIRALLIKEDGIKNPTKNDIIRYKLYQELKCNGYKTIYSNTYIPREKLFSKEFDIEHIIPKSLIFDDSFSNKTLCSRQENIDKGNKCARDFIGPYFGEDKISDYLARVEMLYQFNLKNSVDGINKAKYKKLLMRVDEIGKGFIERDLRDSQYIAKKAREILLEICRSVVSTSGSVTSRLREDWGLVNLMQELNIDKYRKQGLTQFIEKKDGGTKEKILDWTKRNDHRHHAMDALTIAFTKHSHIQYLNNLNARKQENKLGAEIKAIEAKETVQVIDELGNKKRKFKVPMENFRIEAEKHLENILVSCKNKNKVVTKNKNIFKSKAGNKSQITLTPRGQLHKENIYGKIKQYETKEELVSGKFDAEMISKVTSKNYRDALLLRLNENGNDPKKAFTGKNSLDKSPIYLDNEMKQLLPSKLVIGWHEDIYCIRKVINPENFPNIKSIDNIIDLRVKRIIGDRLQDFNGNAKEAFSNLDKNPIFLNREKNIAVKRVTISGVKNVEAIHYKKDHLGQLILDNDGNKMPVDFVSTKNNHHACFYRDQDGNLQDTVITFFEAVERANQGLPIIDKLFNQHLGWKFLFTMKQNEIFIFPAADFDPNEIDLLNPTNNKIISPNLFRVQTISKVSYPNQTVRDYKFRHHLETNVEDTKELKDITYKSIKSLSYFEKIIKVRINHIGKIVKIGEY